MKPSLTLEDAQLLLLDMVNPVELTSIPLWLAAGCILGENIIAETSIPPFDRSAMNGYALREDDIRAINPARPRNLIIVDEVTPDGISQSPLMWGTCIKVMTGTKIPDGTAAVVKSEDVVQQGKYIHVTKELLPGENVVRRGEDVKEGKLVARKGSRITPPLAAIFAALGKNHISVFRTVKAAFLSTGDELLDPSQAAHPGRVFNSNLYGLAARCRELGAKPINLGIAPDDVKATSAKISEGLEVADLVVTTGGVSVDCCDVVVDALQSLGANILFHGVAMKPGSPMVAATKNDKLIIGLSGNSAAAMVSFELMVVPVIKSLMGMNKTLPIKIEGFMADSFPKPSPQRRFLRGHLLPKDGSLLVQLKGSQGNAVLTSLVDCNVLVDIPAGSGAISYGQPVSCLMIGGSETAASNHN